MLDAMLWMRRHQGREAFSTKQIQQISQLRYSSTLPEQTTKNLIVKVSVDGSFVVVVVVGAI